MRFFKNSFYIIINLTISIFLKEVILGLISNNTGCHYTGDYGKIYITKCLNNRVDCKSKLYLT